MGSAGCLRAIGREYEIISHDCGPESQLIGTECRLKIALVCGSESYCLQVATTNALFLKAQIHSQ